MREEVADNVEIPEGIEIEIDNDVVIAKKGAEKIELAIGDMNIEKENNLIKLFNKRGNRGDKRQIKTMAAHIRNMFAGLNEPFVYKLQIASVHFPMNVTYDSAKKEILIKNFLGEKNARKAKIKDGVDVKIERDFIILTSSDKEAAGQSAANIEQATKIKSRDRRVFQDGCYIVEKAGRKL